MRARTTTLVSSGESAKNWTARVDGAMAADDGTGNHLATARLTGMGRMREAATARRLSARMSGLSMGRFVQAEGARWRPPPTG